MARCVRVVTSVFIVAALLLPGEPVSWAATVDYIDEDEKEVIDTVGDIVVLGGTVVRAAKHQKVAVPSALDEAIESIGDLQTRQFLRVSLQPANNPNASGGGQNVSHDGSCVVGYQDSGFGTPFHAFRWTQATGPADLGTLDPMNNATRSSSATDTNQDCSVIVGVSDIAGGATQHAFRWTPNNMVDLGVPNGGGTFSRAFGVNSAGSVIVGEADFPNPNSLATGISRNAFRWSGGSFQDLGGLQPVGGSIASAVSGDGTVVVGQATVDIVVNNVHTNGSRAFRWTTQNSTMVPIGPLSGHQHAVATGVSDNGKIVVGTSSTHPLNRDQFSFIAGDGAFRWSQSNGLQDLRQILVDGGVNMTGITLVSVTGISADGQWIGGQATTTQTAANETVAFIAQVCDDDIGGPCTTTGGGGAAPFILGAAPTQLNVSAGQSAGTTITLTPNSGFTQPVSFSCGGLPQGAACSFNPVTVTPNGGPVNTTLTISTNGGAVAFLRSASPSMFAFMLTPFTLLPIGMLLRRCGSDRRLLSIAVEFIATLTLLGMLSCSGSDSSSPPPTTNSGGSPPATGTPAGTSNVTVTATSGSSSSGVPVTLTVTRP